MHALQLLPSIKLPLVLHIKSLMLVLGESPESIKQSCSNSNSSRLAQAPWMLKLSELVVTWWPWLVGLLLFWGWPHYNNLGYNKNKTIPISSHPFIAKHTSKPNSPQHQTFPEANQALGLQKSCSRPARCLIRSVLGQVFFLFPGTPARVKVGPKYTQCLRKASPSCPCSHSSFSTNH